MRCVRVGGGGVRQRSLQNRLKQSWYNFTYKNEESSSFMEVCLARTDLLLAAGEVESYQFSETISTPR